MTEKRAHFVHAHPGVSLGTVGHHTVVTSHGEDHAPSEAVSIDSSNDGNYDNRLVISWKQNESSRPRHSLGKVIKRWMAGLNITI